MPARVFAGAPRRSLSSHGPRVRPPPFPSPLTPPRPLNPFPSRPPPPPAGPTSCARCTDPALRSPVPFAFIALPMVLAQVNSHVVSAPSGPQDAARFSPENIFKGHLTPLLVTFCKRPDTLPAAESWVPAGGFHVLPQRLRARHQHLGQPPPRPLPALLVALTCLGSGPPRACQPRTLSSCPTSGFCRLFSEQLNLRLCCDRWFYM